MLTIFLKLMKHQIKSCKSVFMRIMAFTSTHLYLFADSEQQMTLTLLHMYALQNDYYQHLHFSSQKRCLCLHH